MSGSRPPPHPEEIIQDFERLHHAPGPMTPERWELLEDAFRQREEIAPKVGDLAPDFELPLLADPTTTVRLINPAGKPTVLAFGSYTCPYFRGHAPRLEELFRRYRNRAHFYLIYIQEAHPSDGWQSEANLREGISIRQTRTITDRGRVATTCRARLQLSIPTLLDDGSNQVDHAYAALPIRLYLVGADGGVTYRGGPGPAGFVPDELEAFLRDLPFKAPAPQSG